MADQGHPEAEVTRLPPSPCPGGTPPCRTAFRSKPEGAPRGGPAEGWGVTCSQACRPASDLGAGGSWEAAHRPAERTPRATETCSWGHPFLLGQCRGASLGLLPRNRRDSVTKTKNNSVQASLQTSLSGFLVVRPSGTEEPALCPAPQSFSQTTTSTPKIPIPESFIGTQVYTAKREIDLMFLEGTHPIHQSRAVLPPDSSQWKTLAGLPPMRPGRRTCSNSARTP